MSWVPIGPTSLRSIDIFGRAPLAGRVRGIALDSTGNRVYVAAACGGVWRSDNAGDTWVSTMDTWDVLATTTHSSPLACGAVAIDPGDPDRVFVGTGEDNWYGGVGPIITTSGGTGATPWTIEPVTAGSPPLAGATFTALAIDPGNTDRVVATTSHGVYRREPDGVGGFQWTQTLVSSGARDVVCVRSGGVTTFYLAQRAAGSTSAGVWSSPDGATWTPLGTGLPSTDVGEIQLAVQPNNPSLVYALYYNSTGTTGAMYRLDLPGTAWKAVSGLPSLFLGQPDLIVGVDPNDAGRVFFGSIAFYVASVAPSGAAYAMTPTSITGVHTDMHAIAYVAGDSDRLWIGCDGGAYFSSDASTAATFTAKNVGLATLQVNAVGLHPTEDGVLFAGTQDNGTLRYDSDEVWRNLTNMDGGDVLVNWNDPYKILANTAGGGFLKATDGGQGFTSFTSVNISGPVLAFVPAVASPPIDPSLPASADLVAVAGTRLFLSSTFGGGWYSVPNNDASDDLPGGDAIGAIAFASAQRIYVGTGQGVVYVYTFDGTSWSPPAPLAAMPSPAAISKLVIDPADTTGNSIYVLLFGGPDYRHVWHWDGSAWTATSGPAPGDPASLPALLYQAFVVDPANPTHLYAGNDTSLWRSLDGGSTWGRFDDNLPHAPVVDLKIHPTRRTIYAATYGRGVYARDLDVASPPAIEIYVRDTALDLGKRPTVDWLPDPLQPGQFLVHWEGPDIKVDAPMPGGIYQLTPPIDDFQFADQLDDLSGAVETVDPSSPAIINRAYVQVHNRGLTSADGVNVMLLLANASTTLPDLPAGYTTNVQTLSPISTADWSTVGIAHVDGLQVGYPQVLEFDLSSTMLPPPAGLPGNAHWCLLALVHQAMDAFTSTQVHVDTLTVNDRKATNKNLHIVPMPAAGHARLSPWFSLRLNGTFDDRQLGDLVFDLHGFPGRIVAWAPEPLERHAHAELLGRVQKGHIEDVERRIRDVRELERGGRFDKRWSAHTIQALELVRDSRPIELHGGKPVTVLRSPELERGHHATVFFTIEPGPQARPGERYRFTVHHRRHDKHVTGGATYEIRMPGKQRV